MQINSISSKDVKFQKFGNKGNIQKLQSVPIRENNQTISASGILANYNKANVAFSGKAMFIPFENQTLWLRVSDKTKEAASVAVEFFSKKSGVDELQKQVVNSAQRKIDDNFWVPISAINHKDNSFLEQIKTGGIKFFDVNGQELSSLEPEIDVTPSKVFAKNSLKKISINGKERFSELDVISNANIKDGAVFRLFDDYSDVKNYRGNEPVMAVLNSNSAFDELLLDTISEDFSLPSTVAGIIVKKPKLQGSGNSFFLNCLSHAKARLDGKQAFITASEDVFESLKTTYRDGSFVRFNANSEGFGIEQIDKLEKLDNKVVLDQIKMAKGILTSESQGFVPEAVGIKAYNLGKLQKMSKEGGFKVPKFFVIQSGEFDIIKKENPLIYTQNNEDVSKNGLYHTYIDVLDNAYDQGAPIDVALNSMQSVIKKDMNYPQNFINRLNKHVNKMFGQLPETLGFRDPRKNIYDNDVVLSVRSSFPCLEDLDKVSSQGMFSSVCGIRANDELLPAIKKVWASKWGEIAYKARREHSIPHDAVQPSVIVQEFVKDIDYIFTGYTGKIDNPDVIRIDLSQGVTSTMQGDPYLFEVNKKTGEIKRVLLATKGRKKQVEHVDLLDKMNAKYTETDYSKDPLNMSFDEYAPFVKKIADTLLFVEKKFGGIPQDIEGGIKWIKDDAGNVKDVDITLWQTRNVQMPKNN